MSIEDLKSRLKRAHSEPCYNRRIERLMGWGRDTSLIENGVADVVRNLENHIRSFVVYGEPQSGKTEFMIALVCKLLDLQYQTIFVVMNDNTELEDQNFDRFHSAPELNPTPLRDYQVLDMTDAVLKTEKQRVIFCRKNKTNLVKLTHACRFMKNRVVIDDEADFATPNAKINKQEVTAINENLELLGELGPAHDGVYIGVTATPARLDLNNTYLNDSTRWVFLESHGNYKGKSFFFPKTLDELSKSDYQLVKLPNENDDPKYLRHAMFRFMLRVGLLNLKPGSEHTAYSMLIHTAGKTDDHKEDQRNVQAVLRILSDENETKYDQYLAELLKVAEFLTELHHSDLTALDLAEFVVGNIGKSEVLVINSKAQGKNVKRAGRPNALFTFAIGGNIVSRGLTFENLLTFFFSRNVKGKLQQNTYIQRARMFGNRPYSRFFELCVPEALFSDWANCFADHEVTIRLARAGVLQHVQSNRTQVSDTAAIDRENVTVEKSERTIGSIFRLTPELEEAFIKHDPTKPITFLESLIAKGLLSDFELPGHLLTYLREIGRADESDTLIVLKSDRSSGQSIQMIDAYSDADEETITRGRGGIIHAMLNKRAEYDSNNHFILPIKNSEGEARLLYKANIGHTILQNLRPNTAVTR